MLQKTDICLGHNHAGFLTTTGTRGCSNMLILSLTRTQLIHVRGSKVNGHAQFDVAAVVDHVQERMWWGAHQVII